MNHAPVPDEGLVRRCAIAAFAATLSAAPALRTVRSPAFARRVDAALAGSDAAVPVALSAQVAARLAEAGLELPDGAPGAPAPVPATALRTLRDGLAWAATRDDAAARRLLAATNLAPDEAAALLTAAAPKNNLLVIIKSGNVVLYADARSAALAFTASLDRIADAYRAQGMTAHELTVTIALEFGLENIAAVFAVAAALDRASALLGGVWEIEELRLALEREVCAAPSDAAPQAEQPRPVSAEPARALPGRRRHSSASSLNLYADCARKWYFRYLCAAVEDKGSSASAYGTAFHAALETFHQTYPKIESSARAELARRLEGTINAAFERYRTGFASEVEYRLSRRRAQRTARKYLAWLLARAAKEPFEVVGCEVEANVSLDGVEFVGYIDRVDRDLRSGRVTVYDYKTGAIAASAAEYRGKINGSREFQLPYYYWAQTEAGHTVRSLALVPLRDPHLDVEPIELEVVPVAEPPSRHERDATHGVISIGELERARTAMVALSRDLASGTIERFAATDDPAACRYCVYAPSCREKPADDDRRFGR